MKLFHYSISWKVTENVYQNEDIKSRERKAYGSRKQRTQLKRGVREIPHRTVNGTEGGVQADSWV